MDTLKQRLSVGVAAMMILFGCQASPPREDSSREPANETAEESPTEQETTVLEETFESGDTGDLSSQAEKPPQAEEQEQDDP